MEYTIELDGETRKREAKFVEEPKPASHSLKMDATKFRIIGYGRGRECRARRSTREGVLWSPEIGPGREQAVMWVMW